MRDRMAAVPALVRESAEEISRIPGYRGEWPPA